jgi:hypothetical protein
MKTYQLKIELKGTQIWRRVIIPVRETFYRLLPFKDPWDGWENFPMNIIFMNLI